MKSKLLELFKENKKYSLGKLKKLLGIKNTDNAALNELAENLKNFELDGKIYYDNYEDCYYSFPSNFFITKLDPLKKGDMIFTLDNQIYRLSKKELNGVLPYDTVILEKTDNNYKLVKILKRFNSQIICEVGPKMSVRVVGNNNINVRFNKQELKDLNLPEGSIISAEISTDEFNGVYDISLLEIIGHKFDFDSELLAISYNNGFITQYTKEELDQLKEIPNHVTEEDKVGRCDKTNENIFTIDGKNTKDMDDAISIKVLDNGNYELTVSIAAVSHYIKFKSPLWKRAERNTTSLYLIQSVAHMLHFQVSNGICSLNPDVERLAKSYVMEVNKSGKVVNFDIQDSVIKSKKKMTYDDVNKILIDGTIIEGYEPFVEDLQKMQELSQILTERRKNDGSIDFYGEKITYVLDDNKKILDIDIEKQDLAEKLIENFMVLTNETIAEYMLNLGMVFIYRNHEVPISQKVIETAKLIKSLGHKVENLQNTNNPKILQNLINSLKNKEEFFILSSLLLRSMQKARFSIENKGHYALALKAYSQVTSPIRRFLDLVIEYILDNLEMFYDPNFDIESFKTYLINMCDRASCLERCADKAEYEADRLYMVDYVKERPTQEYIGFIQEITPKYVFIKTKELIEGYIYFTDINDGNYKYNPDTGFLENRSDNQILTIGSQLIVTLKDCNREERIINFFASTPERIKENNLVRTKNNK